MKRIIAFLVASTFCVGSMLVGCSTDPAKTTTPPTPIELKDVSTSMATLFCDLAFSCCTPMEQIAFFQNFPSVPKTATECKPMIQSQFDTYVVAGLQSAVDAGRLKFDGAAAQSCFDQIKDQCSVLAQDGPFQGAGCATVFIGLVADGGECAQSNECATAGSFCAVPQGLMLGKCQPLAKEGEPCPNYQCATGLACGFVNMMNVCVKPLPDGQMCKGSAECASNFCDFNTSTCGQKKALGAACIGSYECKDGYCETQMKVCTALKADGQACMSFDECQSLDCTMGINTCALSRPTCDGM